MFRLRKHGRAIKLQEQPIQLLLLLLEHPGEVVTREEARKSLWKDDTFVDYDHGLGAALNRLRAALGDSASTPRYIETLPRRGFRFIATVTADSANEVEPVAAGLPAKPGLARYGGWAVAFGVVLLSLYWLSARVSAPTSDGADTTLLLVLPFENLSGDPDQEYFSDGLTEEIITHIGRLCFERIGVIARTSSMAYKNTPQTIGEIGRELGVSYVLEGSVRRDGTRVRITAQLISVHDQLHVWAETYDREAIDYFQDSIALDPLFAPPYAGLADCYTLLASFDMMSPEEAQVKSRAMTTRALELDPNLPEAYTSLGVLRHAYDWDWSGASEAYLRAIELNPSFATAYHWYALHLAGLGQFEQALVEMRRARTLDPLCVGILTTPRHNCNTGSGSDILPSMVRPFGRSYACKW